MDVNNKWVRLAGVFFLIQLVTYFVGHESMLGPLLFAPDNLTNLSNNSTTVIIAFLLEMISGLAFVGFAILLFPIFKKHNYKIAIGYLGLRFAEFMVIVYCQISLLSLLGISKQYSIANASEATTLQLIGDGLFIEWKLASLILMFVFSFGAILFALLLYQSKLVPRFIAIWGFAGAILSLIATVLIIGGFAPGGAIMYLPIGLNELFVAIWLIVKGGNLVPGREPVG